MEDNGGSLSSAAEQYAPTMDGGEARPVSGAVESVGLLRRRPRRPKLPDGYCREEDDSPSAIVEYEDCEDIEPALEAGIAIPEGERHSASTEDLLREVRLVQGLALRQSIYTHEHRLRRFRLNRELERRDIGPRWRQPEMNSYSKGQKCQAKLRYRCDSLIIDLLWIRNQATDEYRRRMHDFEFGALFDDRLGFDFRLAEQFARSEISTPVRIERLRLTAHQQVELVYLRTQQITQKIRLARSHSMDVEQQLHTVADRNRSRGDKLRAQIPEWSDAAECLSLAEGNVSVAAKFMRSMGGPSVSRTWMSTRADKIRDALRELQPISDRSLEAEH